MVDLGRIAALLAGRKPGHALPRAFYTDADLPSVRLLRGKQKFLDYAARTKYLDSTLRECGFTPDTEPIHLTVSNGGRTRPSAGHNWFAAGDAAIHFDPISSQGLFNALFTGLAAAESVDRILAGDNPNQAASDYSRLIDGIEDAYLKRLNVCYGDESRWQEYPFWAHRRDSNAH